MTKEKYKEGKKYQVTYLQDGEEKTAIGVVKSSIIHIEMGPGSYFIPDNIMHATEINP